MRLNEATIEKEVAINEALNRVGGVLSTLLISFHFCVHSFILLIHCAAEDTTCRLWMVTHLFLVRHDQ